MLASARPQPQASKRVLVVDDDEICRMVVQRILRRAGFDVEEAGDGDTAMAMAAKRSYALVLLDLHMPGLDGLETAQLWRAAESRAAPRSQLVLLTADANPRLLRRSMGAGIDGLLTKPAPAELLCDWAELARRRFVRQQEAPRVSVRARAPRSSRR